MLFINCAHMPLKKDMFHCQRLIFFYVFLTARNAIEHNQTMQITFPPKKNRKEISCIIQFTCSIVLCFYIHNINNIFNKKYFIYISQVIKQFLFFLIASITFSSRSRQAMIRLRIYCKKILK